MEYAETQIQPIHLFYGDEYAIDYEYGDDYEFGFNLIKSVGNFASNAVKVAGKGIGIVTKPITTVTGAVTKTVGRIPVIGSPLKTVLGASYSIAMSPINITIAISEGKRIDKVLLGQLKEQLKSFKQVAPYAQMVISIVPGIGTGVSAALSAGLALAEGQSITEVLKAGLIGAIPGGPLVKASVTMGVETIQRVAKGEKVDLKTLSQTAGGIASSALGLPLAAKNALLAGITITGDIASGKPIDKIVIDNAIKGLPVSDSIKRAMTDVTAISSDIARGKKVTPAMALRINTIIKALPASNPLHDTVKTAIDTLKKGVGKDTDKIISAALNSGVSDVLISAGAKTLPADVQKGIKTGIALGSGVVAQGTRKSAIKGSLGKLTQTSVTLAKKSPVIAAGRKIATKAGPQVTKGFDVGTGLLQHQAKTFDVAVVRNNMKPEEKKGFDMAVALRVGAVSQPAPKKASPTVQAGFAITAGMQSYVPARKVAIMKTVQKTPGAAVGATVAVKQIAKTRESWLIRILKALGLRK